MGVTRAPPLRRVASSRRDKSVCRQIDLRRTVPHSNSHFFFANRDLWQGFVYEDLR
jgi:hypothetical protein